MPSACALCIWSKTKVSATFDRRNVAWRLLLSKRCAANGNQFEVSAIRAWLHRGHLLVLICYGITMQMIINNLHIVAMHLISLWLNDWLKNDARCSLLFSFYFFIFFFFRLQMTNRRDSCDINYSSKMNMEIFSHFELHLTMTIVMNINFVANQNMVISLVWCVLAVYSWFWWQCTDSRDVWTFFISMQNFLNFSALTDSVRWPL